MEREERMIDRIRTRKEFAERLHVSTRTLDRLEKRGALPPRVKISDRLVGYRESDVAAFISSQAPLRCRIENLEAPRDQV